MPWLEVNLEVPQSEAENASEALQNAGALAVTLQSHGDEEVLEPGVGETPLWSNVRITGLFDTNTNREKLQNQLLSLGLVQRPDHLQYSELADQEWERSWMDRFQPMCFGERLWIYPSTMEPPANSDTIIRLDPGLAFGTGTHATTALCLRWLDAALLEGVTVVDYGCGSGILAIAAALLGAEKIIAVDNDPQALLATKTNAERNGVDGLIEVIKPREFAARDVGLVLANILSQPLIELAPVLTGCLGRNGRLVLSGIMENQADAVQGAYSTSVQWQDKTIENGWVRLFGTKYMNEQIEQTHASKDRDYHAVIAPEYEQVVNEPRAFPNELLFRPIDRMLPATGNSMLDLGCGTGQMLRRYANRFEHFTGVDHSREMLAVANDNLEEHQRATTRLLKSDVVEFLSSDTHKYNLLSIVGCLHHLHPGQLESVLRQAAERLAPGGRMLIAEPLQQEEMQPPEAVSQWNRRALSSLPEYSSFIEEPDEAPIEEQQMMASIDKAGLKIIAESRGWELFPRHLPASLFDRINIRRLHRRYGSTGYVRALLLKQAND